MAEQGEVRARTVAAAWIAIAVLAAAGPRTLVSPTPALAIHHRLELPGGSQLLLRREYRAIYRVPMRWSDGLLLERAHFACGARRRGRAVG